ncbi:alpha/beta fold hydrolase [Gloeobacter violaceus]|uniref:Glr3058 protein n=1 Tax=Gloeobacter violaceus (strain ATCC 29082 / PCC 7421) TaxID=251221 RepID=Q7NCC1_GLOVI|nr:alpha/beta fold hydrolase [Gloeobacter violaceus]BAC90999.1 glr3058 [Gloeobacter violaceus PCC 7421]
MTAAFLPPGARILSEPGSLEMARRLELVSVRLEGRVNRTVATGCVHSGAGEPPALLLHGFDSSVFEFRRLLPLLAARREVWAMDLLGFGFTERPAGIAYDPRAIGDHLASFWEQYIGRPALLVGASMGGAAAIDLALARPEAVAKLVLIDSVGFAKPPAVGRWMVPPIDRFAAAFLRNPRVRRRVSLGAYTDPTLVTEDAQICAALHLAMPGWEQAIIAFTRSGGYAPLGEKLPALSPPTLILWGEDDRILDPRDAHKFYKAIPDSRLVWIQNCGHVPHLEKPQVTAGAIEQFAGGD